MTTVHNTPPAVPCRNCRASHATGFRAPAECRLATAEHEYATHEAAYNGATTDAERTRHWRAMDFLWGDVEIARRDVAREAAWTMNRRREREGYRYGILTDD